ncbi:MAG: IS1595 family transposase [Gemmatimonadaceae bacterium]
MAKQHKVGTNKSDIVAAMPAACASEMAAAEFFERTRWNDTPACPRCGDTDVAQMRARSGERNARFLWTCHGCKEQFTVRVGTVMEESRIPLRHWAYAWWAACASKKGVSAKQIQRMTGLSYKSALFLMHRVRFAMAPANAQDGGQLGGTVEVDECYVGGKPRHKGQRRPGRPSAKDKAPVMGMVERDGRARLRYVADLSAPNLKGAIREHIAQSSRIITDEWTSYARIGREFAGGHETVCHSAGEYVRGDVTTNTIESVFAILKRSVYGTWHSVSRKHLHRYLAETEFKYNTRHVDDGERTVRAIQGADGRRLTYKEQTGNIAAPERPA